MSREREKELSSYDSARTGREIAERRGRGPHDDLHGNPPREDYLSMREKRLAEERQYQDQMYTNPELDTHSSDFSRRRKQWDQNPLEARQVRFRDEPYSTRNRTQRWDEEERELIQWAKSQGHSNDGRPRYRAPTPPIYESPQKQEREMESGGHKSLRSISAPVIVEGIAALGARDDTRTRQMKQKKYAEELRTQIREKEEAKRKERMDEHVIMPSSNPTEGLKDTSEFVREAPKRTTLREDEYEKQYEQYDYRERGHDKREYPRRLPLSPTHNAGRHDRYSPYPPPHGYHPHLNPYHNPSWVPPYYQPPYTFHPHMEYPPHPPDPYYHLPMHMGNPYLPVRRPEPWDMEYESRGRRGMEMSKAKEPRLEKENQLLRKSDDDGEEFISPLGGRSSKTPKQTKASYRAELEKQMLEKKEKETQKKLEKERFELKKETEIYDPWGKGGCGAPVRDRRGNLVTDLKKMRKLNNERLMCTSTSPQRPQSTAEDGSGDIDEGSPNTTPQKSPYTYDWKQNEKKVDQDGYRDFLRQQVEEKEAAKRKEKEQKRMEEQKEIDRLEQERKKLQEDYAREQEAQRRKEAELRAKNEVLKREAEEKRREAALMKHQEELEEAEREQEELNRALTERLQQPLPPPRTKSPPIPVIKRRMEQGHLPLPPPSTEDNIDYHQPEYRSSSPPVPTVRHKLMNQQKAPSHPPQEPAAPRSSSPPVPALRKRMQSEVKLEPPNLVTEPRSTAEVHGQTITVSEPRQPESKSSDLLRQLSAMRRHLLSEKDKLSKKQDHTHRKDDDTTSHRSDDIFDMARVQKPRMALPRSRLPPKLGAAPKDSMALSDVLRDFTALRENTTQRGFLREFPEPPLSEGSFVAQQNALIAQQELKLAELRTDRRSKKENKPVSLSHEGSNLLASNSTHVPLSSGSIFSGDSSRAYTRDQAALGPHVSRPRERRQWGLDPTPPLHPHQHRVPSAGGQSQFSVATLDVDNMARQNEERKRRLDAILNASAGNTQEPQAILQNFLSRTNKPQPFTDGRTVTRQSEKSLDCETQFHPIASARI